LEASQIKQGTKRKCKEPGYVKKSLALLTRIKVIVV